MRRARCCAVDERNPGCLVDDAAVDCAPEAGGCGLVGCFEFAGSANQPVGAGVAEAREVRAPRKVAVELHREDRAVVSEVGDPAGDADLGLGLRRADSGVVGRRRLPLDRGNGCSVAERVARRWRHSVRAAVRGSAGSLCPWPRPSPSSPLSVIGARARAPRRGRGRSRSRPGWRRGCRGSRGDSRRSRAARFGRSCGRRVCLRQLGRLGAGRSLHSVRAAP